MVARRPLWTCPRCGNRFVTRNMWHSCVRVTVNDHLRGRPREVVAIYRELARIVRSLGPGVRTVSSKTKTGWMARVRFAGVEFRTDHVVLSFWLKRQISSPRLRRAHYGRRDWVYTIAIRSPAELDEQVRTWLAEAYVVGRQAAPVPPRGVGVSGRSET